MRAQFIALAAVLISTAAFADDHLTLFVSDLGRQTSLTTTSQPGNPSVPVNHENTEWTGAIGIAIAHSWSEHWSAEGAIMRDQRYITGTKVRDSVFFTTRERISSTQADAMLRYHFPNESRWNPYVGAGLHYVQAPDIVSQQIAGVPSPGGVVPITTVTPANRPSAQIGVGTTLRITPSVGLQFDAKRLLRGESEVWDPLTRLSFGVNWRL